MPPRRGGGTTPWASTRGSLLSDRIRPSGPAQPAKLERGKGKAKAATSEPPRSAAVRRLDELLAGLHSSFAQPPNNEGKKATGAAANPQADHEGCFCQARVHALSEYTPLCTACGLVLCDLHAPHRPCAHCRTPLLAPPARAALIAQLEELRAHTLAEEADAREREARELRRAEGAFPALGPSQPQQPPSLPSAGSGRGWAARQGPVVWEVGGGEGGGGAGWWWWCDDDDGEGDATPLLVPPPPREVEYVRVRRGPATRWVDLKAAGSVGTASRIGMYGSLRCRTSTSTS
ncbi:hypothetical protein BJV74DRAFT_889989 [Russula compacta]|nr:hypothetical protein BJV74DRAFT_889989 [Russula compacta]